MDHAWVLIAYLLDHAGISTSANNYYKVMYALVEEQIGCWNILKKRYTEVECVTVK
jgi:hypothetical protein